MPVTAPISLTKVRAEFNGPNNLKAYNRGGVYVPNTPANSNISTNANQLKLSQFLGASKDNMTINQFDFSVYCYDNEHFQSSAYFVFHQDGTIHVDGNGIPFTIPPTLPNWFTGTYSPVEIRAYKKSWSNNNYYPEHDWFNNPLPYSQGSYTNSYPTEDLKHWKIEIRKVGTSQIYTYYIQTLASW